MYSSYKRKRVEPDPEVSYPYNSPYNTHNFDQQPYPRFNHQHRNSVRSLRVSRLREQPQEQTTSIPLPDGPLFERSLLKPIWEDTRTIGPGFINCQNNCFLNSVLQCLIYTPSLAQYFLYHGHRNQCTSIGFCAMCAIDHHVHRCLVEPKSLLKNAAILPRAFLSNLQGFSQTFCLGNQEDAHEFMMFLLDAMHKSTVQGYGKLDADVERTAFIYQIFGGQLRSQLRCRSCNAKSDTFDNFLDLSIDLQDATLIHEALENFIKVDKIGGNDSDSKYRCEACEQKVDAEKQMTIHELPSYLCVHLKRFTLDMDSGYMRKVTEDIQYQENLDMAPFVSEDVVYPWTVYHLYAVLVHVGHRCDRGHYLAYIKAPDGEWFRMDDEEVTHVSLYEVLSQQAYMLFYTREEHDTLPVDIKNESKKVDVLPGYPADETKTISEQRKATSMDLSLALGAATASAAEPKIPPPEKPTEEVACEKGTIKDDKVDYKVEDKVDYKVDDKVYYKVYYKVDYKVEDKVDDMVDDKVKDKVDYKVDEWQPLTPIVGNYDEVYDGCFTDGYSTWMISPSSKSMRSLRGNMSPPTFTAAVSDISIWTIQDQEALDQSYGGLLISNGSNDLNATPYYDNNAYWADTYGQENQSDT